MKEEVEEAMKEMKIRKACGIDVIPIEILKSLGDRGMKDMTHLSNMIYEIGEWPEDFLTAITVPLEKKKGAENAKIFEQLVLIFTQLKCF
ncbi:hypothetical protein J437_LFUL017979 [Ladona fulva]|uniref:Uncharacterized protein n=1 Tax=Ladona fulva TaxID=123851 RepID=A0A8K0KMD6_LADFU|nr:hypothetical protein J437_LFUL017979 [Ladona fulva]